MPGLTLASVFALAVSSAAPPATSDPATSKPAQVSPSTFQAMTLKLDHDEGADHMCPADGQLSAFQANAGLDNAPIVVELLGPDHKPLPDKAWSVVTGLRVLPLIQGPLRITMICSVR